MTTTQQPFIEDIGRPLRFGDVVKDIAGSMPFLLLSKEGNGEWSVLSLLNPHITRFYFVATRVWIILEESRA